MLHLDSRHTVSSIEVAEYAIQKGIPISIDVEKHRSYLETLLPKCDIIFTNESFPVNYMPSIDHKDKGDDNLQNHLTGMATMLQRGRGKLVVTTLGSKGSICMLRTYHNDNNREGGSAATWEENDDQNISSIMEELNLFCGSNACDKESWQQLQTKLTLLPLNVIKKKVKIIDELYIILQCSSIAVPSEHIIDTTGAGDAFIGGFLAGKFKNQASELLFIFIRCHIMYRTDERLFTRTVCKVRNINRSAKTVSIWLKSRFTNYEPIADSTVLKIKICNR